MSIKIDLIKKAGNYFIPVNIIALFLHITHLDDVEKLMLDISTENTTGYLAQKLFENAGNGVDTKILHIDESAGLQEVRELLHGALVARCAEDIFSVRRFFVKL